MKTRLVPIMFLAALFFSAYGFLAAEIQAAPGAYGKPAINKFLAAEHYAISHFDPSQSDVIPYPAPSGTFKVDLTKHPRVSAGPISFSTQASTSPNYMWGTSTQLISYVDVSNGGFKEVARLDDPASVKLAPGVLDRALAKKYITLADAQAVTQKDLGMTQANIMANVYVLVDKDNILYSAYKSAIRAYGLVDPTKPEAGIKLLRTFDFADQLTAEEKPWPLYLSLTYDGKLIVTGAQSMRILDRETFKVLSSFAAGKDELITNSTAIDEKNGIYVASDKFMRKLVWTGSKLSTDAADGAWQSAYDYADKTPPSVKFGRGTGSTPTLMGFGADEDKLVVITDGSDRMKIVAFWRDAIPANAKPAPGAKSNRIAGQFAITCGFNPLPEFIQSEQSVVVKGYGAFVVNNIRAQGTEDRLVDVLAGGPVFAPAVGVERVEWDVKTHAWKSVWTRNDVVSTSMVPAVSGPSNIVFVNGYVKKDGWEVTGMDWNTGKTVTHVIFGENNLGNGAYAVIQFLSNGDMLFNSIGGPVRVNLRK